MLVATRRAHRLVVVFTQNSAADGQSLALTSTLLDTVRFTG